MEKNLDELKKMYHQSYYLNNADGEMEKDFTKKLDECMLLAQRILYKNNTLDLDSITPKRYQEITFNETI
tara:strand:+ start:459 stop:668 length:210 start_codon:yes stop_codon:yes gene_type:complete